MKSYNPEPVKSRPAAPPHLCWSTARNLLAGFFPMWLKARAASSSLASAAIEARRGDYEPARQAERFETGSGTTTSQVPKLTRHAALSDWPQSSVYIRTILYSAGIHSALAGPFFLWIHRNDLGAGL